MLRGSGELYRVPSTPPGGNDGHDHEGAGDRRQSLTREAFFRGGQLPAEPYLPCRTRNPSRRTDSMSGVPLAVVEAIRAACLRTALEAYEDAGLRGLCPEGRWECAVGALRHLDLQSVLEAAEHRPAKPHRS
jgi:hypothetical protein